MYKNLKNILIWVLLTGLVFSFSGCSSMSSRPGTQSVDVPGDEKGMSKIQIIEERYKITLPKGAKILNCRINFDACDAKILISQSDVEPFASSIKSYWKQELILERMPNVNNIINWWDMDKSKVKYYFRRFQNGGPLPDETAVPGRSYPMSVQSDIFIVVDKNRAFIYLSMPYRVGSYDIGEPVTDYYPNDSTTPAVS